MPISIDQYWDAFLDDSAYYFFDELYRYLGSEVLESNYWQHNTNEDKMTRTLETKVPTGIILIKTAKSNIEITLLEKSATAIKFEMAFNASP